MPDLEKPSYEELAARVAELLAVVAEQAALIESLRAEVAALRRQAGRDSSNSSQPPSQDGPAAEAKARAGGRRARPGRAQGGQKGHPGAGLARVARPDETRVVEPGACAGCGADLVGALLRAPVSTGFVSRCLVRLDAALIAAGFEDVLKDALRAAAVLGTDETPAPLATAATSAEDCGNPHVYTVRTMRAYTGGGPDLIWYGAAGNRTKLAITGFGILDGYRGVLVRDDYGGYLSYDAGLAGVQQCLAHLYRYLDDAYAIDPVSQVWTRQAGDALRGAAAAVRAALAAVVIHDTRARAALPDALSGNAWMPPHPAEATNQDPLTGYDYRIGRQRVVGGLTHEYQSAAWHPQDATRRRKSPPRSRIRAQ